MAGSGGAIIRGKPPGGRALTDSLPGSVGPARFPSQTAWSLIMASRDRASPDFKSRFDALVARYWNPVRGYLVRRWNLSPSDAADLTQEFFMRLYERDQLLEAAPERGRFRTFIKLKLRNLVVDDLRRRSAVKRGGGLPAASLFPNGSAEEEPAWAGLAPEDAFDREWASGILNQAIEELERTLRAQGKGAWYDAFWNATVSDPPKSYAETAALLSVKESDVANYVFRSRAELRRILRGLVRESVEEDGEADDEVAYLIKLFEA